MNIKKRKTAHIKLVRRGQVDIKQLDSRFHYEPLLAPHNNSFNHTFLNKVIGAPIFLSSITGGTKKSKKINNNISITSKELKLPMGLGSIRPLLDDPNDESYSTGYITYGNIGIAQLNRVDDINRVIEKMSLDGLIIHINPLQEWCQPDGDIYLEKPIDTLYKYLSNIEGKIIIKEVGCGFGPQSLEELLKMQIDVIDLSGFGGTSFTKIELLRSKKIFKDFYRPLIGLGESNEDMIDYLNKHLEKGLGMNKEYIVSGGIRNFLDGYYYTSKLNANSIYGYAGNILKYANKSSTALIDYLKKDIEGYNLSRSYLTIR